MKRNTKIAAVMMALSAMAMGSTSAFAHSGHTLCSGKMPADQRTADSVAENP